MNKELIDIESLLCRWIAQTGAICKPYFEVSDRISAKKYISLQMIEVKTCVGMAWVNT